MKLIKAGIAAEYAVQMAGALQSHLQTMLQHAKLVSEMRKETTPAAVATAPEMKENENFTQYLSRLRGGGGTN